PRSTLFPYTTLFRSLLGPRRRPSREGQGARGGHLPDQAADRPGSSRPGPGVGCALRLCDCGRRLRRQPQLPGWLGEASQALRGRCPRRLRRGPVAARRADATGRCPGEGAGGAVVALGDLAGGEPGLDARAVCRVAWLARDVVGASSFGLADRCGCLRRQAALLLE